MMTSQNHIDGQNSDQCKNHAVVRHADAEAEGKSRDRSSYFSGLHIVTGDLCMNLMRGQQLWDGFRQDGVQGSHSWAVLQAPFLGWFHEARLTCEYRLKTQSVNLCSSALMFLYQACVQPTWGASYHFFFLWRGNAVVKSTEVFTAVMAWLLILRLNSPLAGEHLLQQIATLTNRGVEVSHSDTLNWRCSPQGHVLMPIWSLQLCFTHRGNCSTNMSR